jgi:SAM-dependent methyltransferase
VVGRLEYYLSVLTRLPSTVKRILFGGTRRFCPVCGRGSRRFVSFGRPRRRDAQCVWCASLERHRLFWLYVQRRSGLLDGAPLKVLHVAPESCFAPRLRAQLGTGYLTADMKGGRADVQMDVTGINYPDETFDRIICSHVLEHVPDDRKAMRELRRVLKKSGEAVILVPVDDRLRTYEDPTITSSSQRTRAFGQYDHVRRYGADYVDRLREAAFAVETLTVEDLASSEEASRMGLRPAVTGDIFVCRPAG